MDNILMLSLSSLDNDSRILKSINSLQTFKYTVDCISNGTKRVFNFTNFDIGYIAKRYLGIPKIGYFILWYKILMLLHKLDLKRYGIVHCNDLNTLPIGFIIKKFINKDVRVIYDAHEYETEVKGLKGIQKVFVQILENHLIKYADKVITVSDAIADEYVKNYNIEKPALILNTPPYQDVEKKDIFREVLNIPKDKVIFLYQGGLSKDRGIEILLDTFKNMDENKPVIVFMGSGHLQVLVEKTSEEYENIFFHNAVDPNVLLEYTSSADFGILFYENSCLNHYYCSPNKIFEYLMAEIPVIVSNLYEMKRLVQRNSIGVVAKENSPKGLQKAIEEAILLDQREVMKNIQKVKEIYNWEEQEKILVSIYKDLSNV